MANAAWPSSAASVCDTIHSRRASAIQPSRPGAALRNGMPMWNGRLDRDNLLRLGFLLAVAAGGGLLAAAGWKSIENYQPPPALQTDLPGGEALSGRVLLIVLDGIRWDVVPRMEFLSGLAGQGSWGTTTAVQPSLSLPARASMVTGARPEVHGVTTNGRIFKTVGDSVFSLAKKADLPVAAAGWRFWSESLGDALGENIFIYRDKPSDDAPVSDFLAWQRDRCRQAVSFLSQWDRGMMVVSAVTPDIVGHRFGGKSPQYVESAMGADRCIQLVVNSMDDGRTTFIVASDHGHIDRRGRGGHGGSESEVAEVPTVLFGRSVKRGGGWRGKQLDIAPTICALLGLPMPASNQGRILWEAIEVPPGIRGQLQLRSRQQRAFARAMLPSEQSGRAQERRNRLPVALAIAGFFCGAIFWTGFHGLRPRMPALLGVACYYAAYYFLFWAAGLGYSLSSVGQEGAAWSFVARNMAAAALALLAATSVVIAVVRRLATAIGDFVLDLAILISATIGIQAAAVHLQHGLFMVRFVPDLTWILKAYLDLTQSTAIGLTASLLFVVATCQPASKSGIARWQTVPPR